MSTDSRFRQRNRLRLDSVGVTQGPIVVRADVVELVDTQVLGTCAFERAGSSPVIGTMYLSLGLQTKFELLR